MRRLYVFRGCPERNHYFGPSEVASFQILQESLIALKTILKEIDPLAFDESLKLKKDPKNNSITYKQDEEDRKKMDKKWDILNAKLKS